MEKPLKLCLTSFRQNRVLLGVLDPIFVYRIDTKF